MRDALLTFVPFVATALPTIVLAAWPKSRRFAHLPFALVVLVAGAWLAFQMGHVDHAARLGLDPHPCGNAFGVPLLGLFVIGAWTFAFGAVVAIWQPARRAGLKLVTRVLPLFVATCIVSGAIGRFV